MNEDFDFRAWSHRAADWSADYLDSIGERAVRPKVKPGAIAAQIGDTAPETGEAMEAIFEDFERIIPDGMTHWQHPRFFAYFQSNAAPAAQLAEQLATAFASQCMLWQTSPAATELEIKMVDWLRQALGLPDGFKGSFQDTASSVTLCAVLTMREKALGFTGNKEGLSAKNRCGFTHRAGLIRLSTRRFGLQAWARQSGKNPNRVGAAFLHGWRCAQTGNSRRPRQWNDTSRCCHLRRRDIRGRHRQCC